MTETVASQVKAIAFDHDIERLTEGFTGREWVFEEIDQWLQQRNERFFILTGEPGVGKSAIAAQLTQTRKDIAAYHFCIARQISTVEPNNVLLSLAAQLIKYFPDYGEALVNTVKPLFLQVNVEINIENIRDSVVQGVVIENLHIHYPKQALDIVLRQALAALPNPPKKPVLILIDSLDEAVTYSNENNLVTLLSSVDDLPSWVRFILTSRPDKQRVLSYFQTLKPYYYHLNELSEKNKKDIHQYVDRRVVSEPIQVQIQRFQVQPEALINQITELSQGNFLYAKVLLDDIELGGQPLDNLAALPKSLNELYYNFLLRLKAEWEGKYQPIFGILTVTKASVTEEELANLLSEQLNETELGQRLRVVQQFLDVVQNDYAENTYTLFHQSLQDYLTDKEKSGVFYCSPKDGHRQIIEYCWQYHPRDWRECDRYGLRYLALHLVDMAALEKPPIKARKYIEKLHELLATEVDERNAWFDAKDRIGDTAGFLADIALAWTKAEEKFEQEPEEMFGLQYRYALMTSCINSLAGNIPSTLLIALVEKGLWTPEQGRVYARLIPKLQQRAVTLKELALHVSQPYRDQMLGEALKIAQIVYDVSSRSQIIITLVPHLPEALLSEAVKLARSIRDKDYYALTLAALVPYEPEVLSEVFNAVLGIGSDSYKVLISLAPYLSESQLYEALNAIRAYQHQDYIFSVLKGLAPYLPEALLPDALNFILAVEDEHWRAGALRVLVPYLPECLLHRTFDVVRTFRDEVDYAQTLTTLAFYIPETLSEAFNVALALKDESLRTTALTTFVPHLPESLLPEAFNIALALEDKSYRAQALTALVSRLPKALSEALNAAIAIESGFSRTSALLALVPYSDTDLLEALSSALSEARNTVVASQQEQRHWDRAFREDGYYLSKLEDWVAHLPKVLLPEALNIALAFRRESYCASGLVALAPHLSETLLPKALNLALAFQGEYDRTQALTALVPHLSETLLLKVLNSVLAIRDEFPRVNILISLAPHVPKVLPDAFSTALAIQDEYSRVQALTGLAPYLPEALLPEGLNAAIAFGNQWYGKELLAALAPCLPEILLPQAFKAAIAIQDESNRTKFLAALAPCLPKALLPDMLNAVLRERSESESVTDLIALATHLPENLLPEVLDASLTLTVEDYRVKALTALAPRLPKVLLAEAVDAALAILNNFYSNKYNVVKLLKALIPHLPEALLSRILIAPLSLEYVLGEYEHTEILIALASILPTSLLPGVLDATATLQEKSYRSRVLNALATRFPEVLSEAFNVARSLDNDNFRFQFLIELVPHLPEDLLPEALHAALAIEDEYQCIEALIELIPYLPEALPKALNIALAIESVKAITTLIPQLPESLLLEVLHMAGTLKANSYYHEKANLLGTLACYIPESCLSEVLNITLAIEDEYERSDVLVKIAPHLPKALLPEALNAGLAIEHENQRIETLKALVPHLSDILISKVLNVALIIENESERSQLLALLAPHLPKKLLSEVLNATRLFQREGDQAHVLTALASHLPEVLRSDFLKAVLALENAERRTQNFIALGPYQLRAYLPEAFNAALSIEDETSRVQALSDLVPILMEPSINTYSILKDSFHVLSNRTRKEFFLATQSFTPVIIALGDKTVEQAAGAIQDVGRWWK